MTACDSCGASVPSGAAVCDLCGTPVTTTPLEGTPSPDHAQSGPGNACPHCGHVAPAGSRFCNACGEPLPTDAEDAVVLPPASNGTPTVRPSSDAGRRALAVVGIGAGLVIGLYLLTVFAPRPEPAPPADPQAEIGQAAPIPDGAPPLADSLQTPADQFAALGTADGWYESGRYYLTAAFQSVQTDPTSSVRWARRAIEDFEKSLALAEDPRVRVALAEAATFDPADPMRPIQELRTVLETDPDNLDATYLLAQRRLMIGRVDSARVALERILELAPPGTPVRERAEQDLATIDSESGG